MAKDSWQFCTVIKWQITVFAFYNYDIRCMFVFVYAMHANLEIMFNDK